MIARSASRSARSLARSVPSSCIKTSARQVPCFRTYATGSSSSLPKSSDAPWAIASVVGFGGLFVYLTAPGSHKEGHSDGHGDHKSKEAQESTEEDAEAEDETEPEPPKEPKELPDGSIEHPEGFVEVKRPDPRDDAPEGDKHLDSKKIADEDAFDKQSKVKRERALPHDDTTFKHGVAAAKDGNPVSDPKAVVAKAKIAKEEKAKAKAEASEQA